MTGTEPLRVALAPGEPHVRRLAGALREAGHDATVIGASAPRADALLRRRGFTAPLAHLPLVAAALARGDYDLVHAFDPADAAAALLWRRRSGRPVVFTCAERLGRERLADGRLRLRLLQRAVEETDAVLVPGEEQRAALLRWMAVDARVLDAGDARGHELLYGELLRK